MASSQDPMKLATQVHKLETQLADVTKEKDGLAKELSRLRDLNKRGDAELQKAIGVLNKSKEAQHLSLVMDERDTYQQQVSGQDVTQQRGVTERQDGAHCSGSSDFCLY